MSAPVPVQRVAWDWLRPYRLLKEPRAVSALHGMAYVVVALGIGLPTIMFAPQTALGAHIDSSLVWATGVLTMLGGVLALLSLFGGTWFAERFGIALILGGLLARLVIVMNLPEHLADGRPIRLAEVVVVWLLLLARSRRIAGLALDPTRGRA